MLSYLFRFMLELRWLRSFVAVAEEMHFSRAARKLNLAQPALTAQIHQLEEAVGAPLFERTNKMGGLTASGLALLPEAIQILESSSRCVGIVKRAALGETGVLRLGLIPPAVTSSLADGLRRFSAQYPGVGLTIRQGDQNKLIERLVAKELDLLIGRPTKTGSNSTSLRQKKLFTEEQGILLRADDPLAKMSRVPIKKIAGRKLVLLRSNIFFGQLLLGHAAKHGATLTPLYSAEDFPSIYWMVRAGLGIAPCSLLLSDGLPRGLVAKMITPPPARLEIAAIWRGSTAEPSVVRFIETLEDV